MGKPHHFNGDPAFAGRTQSELKYLSSSGKEIKYEIPLVVTSETGTA